MARSRDAQPDPIALRRTIERAIRRQDPDSEVLTMLERLQRMAMEGSDERRFAERSLAELLLETDPWRAAVYVRRLIAGSGDDDACWALMGLAQALLGNHRFAATAYRRALARDPGNPWYCHNLGHLMDVALNQPMAAVPYLQTAHRKVPGTSAITCSYVHALWRSGRSDEARRVLGPLLRRDGRDPEVWALAAQLDAERPPRVRRKKAAPSLPAAGAPKVAEPARRPPRR